MQVRGTAGTRRNGVWQFAITDHLGNERVRFDQNGQVLERNHYYAYGLRHPGWSSTPLAASDARYAFAGGERTADELGVQWQRNGARMYDPVLGRFLGVEPLADLYSSVSGYAYALCDPVNRLDPTGFFAEDCGCDPTKDPDCAHEGPEFEDVPIVATQSLPPPGDVTIWIRFRGASSAFLNGAKDAWAWLLVNKDATHVVLGAIGSSEIPVASQIADIFDAALSLTEGDTEGALLSAGGILIPGLSQTKLARTALKVGGKALKHTADQKALKELVKEVTKNGKKAISVADAKIIRDFAKEVNYPGVRASMADLAKQNNHWVGGPHMHFPGVGSGHIKVIR